MSPKTKSLSVREVVEHLTKENLTPASVGIGVAQATLGAHAALLNWLDRGDPVSLEIYGHARRRLEAEILAEKRGRA